MSLTTEERETLTALVNKGRGSTPRLRRARILLMTNENQEEGAWKDADIAKALSAHVRTAERTREKRVEMGVAIIPQEMCTALQLIRLPLILRN